MVKYTKNVCEKCSRKFKSGKAMARHKCDAIPSVNTQNSKIQCYLCKIWVRPNSYKEHQLRCQRDDFFRVFGSLLTLLFASVKMFNAKIKRFNHFGFIEDQKVAVYDRRHKTLNGTSNREKKIQDTNLNKNARFLNLMTNDKDKKTLAEVENTGTIPNKKIVRVVQEINNHFFPSISFHDIVFKYLEKEGINNKYIEHRLKRAYRDPYPTDKEIKAFPRLYDDLITARARYITWKVQYDKFYFKIEKFKQERHCFDCKYCGKLTFNEKKHINYCPDAEEAYESNRRDFIEDYIRSYHKSELWSLSEENTMIGKGLVMDFQQFKIEFPSLIKYRARLVRKIEDRKKEIDKERSERRKERKKIQWGKMFIDEVNNMLDNNNNIDIDSYSESSEDTKNFANDPEIGNISDKDKTDDEPELSSEDNEEKSYIEYNKITSTTNKFFDFSKIGKNLIIDETGGIKYEKEENISIPNPYINKKLYNESLTEKIKSKKEDEIFKEKLDEFNKKYKNDPYNQKRGIEYVEIAPKSLNRFVFKKTKKMLKFLNN